MRLITESTIGLEVFEYTIASQPRISDKDVKAIREVLKPSGKKEKASNKADIFINHILTQ